jgi:hypothetical protein
MPSTVAKDLTDVFSKITEYDIAGLFQDVTVSVDGYGVWIWVHYKLASQDQIIENIINVLDKHFAMFFQLLSPDINQTIVKNATLNCLNRMPTANELNQYGQLLSTGASADFVKNQICMLPEAQELRFMQGFDLNKINKRHNQLIISIGGAGVWGPGVLADTKGPIETIVYGEQPKSKSYRSDGIYQKSYQFLRSNTVSIIGYPWLTYGGIVDDNQVCPNGALDCFDRKWWKPDAKKFAEKIRLALQSMAPNSKVILMGKSMGGCIISEIANELNASGVTVDLLILVDPSCKLSDQSLEVKPMLTNVKKVYNIRQTNPYPNNGGQNGFQISVTSPTIGTDIVVNIPNNKVTCDNVNHNNIDECDNLHAFIDREVIRILGRDVGAIVNALLLD